MYRWKVKERVEIFEFYYENGHSVVPKFMALRAFGFLCMWICERSGSREQSSKSWENWKPICVKLWQRYFPKCVEKSLKIASKRLSSAKIWIFYVCSSALLSQAQNEKHINEKTTTGYNKPF